MFRFFSKKDPVQTAPKEAVKQIRVDESCNGLESDFFQFDGQASPLALAYISPHLDFQAVTRKLAQIAGDTKVIAMTTAGELCSEEGCSVYLSADASWRTIVIQAYSPALISRAEVKTVPLHCEDLSAGAAVLDHSTRVNRIAEELPHITPSFKIDAKNTFALTFIDGLSKSENYLMEAVYKSEKFPCLFVGGSAGGKLDFQDTWLFDGYNVIKNKAIVVFVKMAEGQRYGVLKSQNFKKVGDSYIVVDADPNQRTVTSVFDPLSHKVVPFIDVLCKKFKTSRDRLQDALANYAFGIEIEDEIFVRSVANIDTQSGVITFYCDLDIGDQLITLEQTDFLSQTRADISDYFRGKPEPSAIMLNDCILRRLSNAEALSGMRDIWPAPAAGFSTFGELYGININQTLSAIVFFSDVEEEYDDTFIDNFPLHYARFSNYFSRRNLMREEREKMRIELRSAFGEVLNAAVEGDFSQRITREFSDAELNKLAFRVNTLVESVDIGLQETGSVLAAIANADLTQRVNSDFKGAFQKLKTDTNGVAEGLSEIVQRLNMSSQTLKTTTGNLLTSAHDLNRRTIEQAAANEETGIGVERLSTTVSENSTKALTATGSNKELVQAAETSSSAMTLAIDAMGHIKTTSSSIVEVVEMIEDIAFKTNLLALNASVEAARVGEHGRGFAVVAGEVRNLASSAAKASEDVKALINQSVKEVEQGSTYVSEVSIKLTEMLTLVHDNDGVMAEIAQASTEQSVSIGEVNGAVRHMGQMTEQNAQLVQQIHAAIEETEAQSAEIDRVVNFFHLNQNEYSAQESPDHYQASADSPTQGIERQWHSNSA